MNGNKVNQQRGEVLLTRRPKLDDDFAAVLRRCDGDPLGLVVGTLPRQFDEDSVAATLGRLHAAPTKEFCERQIV